MHAATVFSGAYICKDTLALPRWRSSRGRALPLQVLGGPCSSCSGLDCSFGCCLPNLERSSSIVAAFRGMPLRLSADSGCSIGHGGCSGLGDLCRMAPDGHLAEYITQSQACLCFFVVWDALMMLTTPCTISICLLVIC